MIRYIQVVEDEEYIGTLLQTNETVITSLQLYDKVRLAPHDSSYSRQAFASSRPHQLLLTRPSFFPSRQLSKPASEDSDDDVPAKTAEEEELSRSLAAARLQKERESELAKLQAKQKAAVDKEMARRKAWEEEQNNLHPDLAGLDGLNFGSTS